MGKCNLYLITAEYPYGKGESFIENEINFLSEKFQKIYLIPLSKKGKDTRAVPQNIIVSDVLIQDFERNTFSVFSKNLFYILKILFIELFKTNKKLFFLKNIRSLNSFLCQNINRANCLNDFIILENGDETKNVFYSFWMNE